MDEPKRELVRGWLTKARNDLDTARQIAGLPDGHLDTAIYHCQQSAEKAVKAFLAFRDHRIERSHDVEHLISVAARYDPAFADYVDAGVTLTPYATAYRYPGEAGALEPSRSEFDEAFEKAESVFRFVSTVLPKDTQPR